MLYFATFVQGTLQKEEIILPLATDVTRTAFVLALLPGLGNAPPTPVNFWEAISASAHVVVVGVKLVWTGPYKNNALASMQVIDWKVGGPLCPICSLLSFRPYAKLGDQLDDRRWNWLSEAWYRAPHHIPHAGWWCLLESLPKPIDQKYSVYADMKGAAINRILKQ